MAEADDKVLQGLLDDLMHSGIDELLVENIAGLYGRNDEMTTEEIEEEWKNSGGPKTENVNTKDWHGRIVMYFHMPEDVAEFERRLELQEGIIEKRQGHSSWLYRPVKITSGGMT